LQTQSPSASASSLRGIVLREDADTLVVRATDAEVARFGSGASVQVALAQARGGDARPDWHALMDTGLLYDAVGNPVARISDISMESEMLETTMFGDTHRGYMRGVNRVNIRAIGI
jgi:hypothetical protein